MSLSEDSFEEDWPLGFADDDRARFTALVMDAFSALHVDVAGQVPDLVLPGGGLLNLRNLATSCDGLDRGLWPAEVKHFIGAIAAQASHGDLSPEVARASLRLRLLFESGDYEGLVSRPSLPGLSVALFIRRPSMGQSISQSMLDAWGIDVDEAFTLAEANTWEHERGEFVEYDDMSALEGDSLFTSAGVVRIREWFDLGAYGSLIAVPSRHVVLAKRVDREAIGLLGAFAQLVQELMDQSPGPTASFIWYVEPATFGIFGEGAELVGVDIVESPGLDPRLEISAGPQLGIALERLGRAQLD
jgi:hypothetical protein